MNVNGPIGVFDSGIGGLTVLKELLSVLPDEDFIYFGDLARLPYGSKSPHVIKHYALQNSTFLIEKGVKAIVVACNTATSVALDFLQSIFSIPIIGVIKPAVLKALEVSKNYKIGVIGTRATINSGKYGEILREQAKVKNISEKILKIYEISTPLFVPLIEEGFKDHKIIYDIIEEYLGKYKNLIDTLILGCTHYPIISDKLDIYFEKRVNIVDSASNTAIYLKELLMAKGLLKNKRENKQKVKIYLSDITENFEFLEKLILNENYGYEKINISDLI